MHNYYYSIFIMHCIRELYIVFNNYFISSTLGGALSGAKDGTLVGAAIVL